MKTQETRNKGGRLERLCPFAGACGETDYREREICSNGYKEYENYLIFKRQNIKFEKLPPGICWGAMETLVDKVFLSWKLLGIGRVHKDEKERIPPQNPLK